MTHHVLNNLQDLHEHFRVHEQIDERIYEYAGIMGWLDGHVTLDHWEKDVNHIEVVLEEYVCRP
jgi:hypothetical protein